MAKGGQPPFRATRGGTGAPRLERVVAGETLDVTDRGHIVAMLVPVRPGATLVDRLVASGRAIPASRRLEDLPPLRGKIPADLGEQLQRALQESREDKT